MTVLIPAYEPTEKMLSLVLELRKKTDYNILIVDDGSSNKYRELFTKAGWYGCKVLHHKRNYGKGEALKTGFSYLSSGCTQGNVVCADSDGQHSVDDIIRLANTINGSKAEMVLGVRQFEGKVPFKSRYGNRISAFFFRLATSIDLKDTQTGLRGYPYELLPWLCTIEGSRFEYELNLLLRSKESGISIKQVPIATIYENNNKGTHFRALRDSVCVLMPIFKFCGSSLISAALDFVLLFLFQWLTGSLFLGVVLARVISSVFNYTVNKIVVFKAGNMSNSQSAPRYFSLVVLIMLLNYCLLAFLSRIAGIPDVPAKLLTEITLFTISYSVQKLFIFRRNKTRSPYPGHI